MVPKNERIRKFSEVCYRSKFEIVWFRSGRGRIEAGKMDRGRAKGGPLVTKNGHLWPNHRQNLAKLLAIILVTLTTLHLDCRGSRELKQRPGRLGEGQGGPNKSHLDPNNI